MVLDTIFFAVIFSAWLCLMAFFARSIMQSRASIRESKESMCESRAKLVGYRDVYASRGDHQKVAEVEGSIRYVDKCLGRYQCGTASIQPRPSTTLPTS